MRILKSKLTVDGIMSAFSKTISDLGAVEKSSLDLAEQKETDAEILRAEAYQARTEATRASEIASNLRGILGTD